MSIHRDRNILSEVQLVAAECAVDANASTPELVIGRRAVLIEEIEGDAIRVIVTAAGDIEVVVADVGRAENLLPPVGPGASRHDQRAREGILAGIDARGTAIR